MDIPCNHITISSQHAVIQYRRRQISDEYGDIRYTVSPYIMDLESVHGTFLNDEKIDAHRFYEILARDSIRFGLSTRTYVALCDDSIKKDVLAANEIDIEKDNHNNDDKDTDDDESGNSNGTKSKKSKKKKKKKKKRKNKKQKSADEELREKNYQIWSDDDDD